MGGAGLPGRVRVRLRRLRHPRARPPAARVEATPRASEQCVVVACRSAMTAGRRSRARRSTARGSPARRREGDLDRTVPAGYVWSLTRTHSWRDGLWRKRIASAAAQDRVDAPLELVGRVVLRVEVAAGERVEAAGRELPHEPRRGLRRRPRRARRGKRPRSSRCARARADREDTDPVGLQLEGERLAEPVTAALLELYAVDFELAGTRPCSP